MCFVPLTHNIPHKQPDPYPPPIPSESEAAEKRKKQQRSGKNVAESKKNVHPMFCVSLQRLFHVQFNDTSIRTSKLKQHFRRQPLYAFLFTFFTTLSLSLYLFLHNARHGPTRKKNQVAWLKSDSKAILAIHTHMVALNPRLEVTHNGHNTWKLNIAHVQLNDSGSYMCQGMIFLQHQTQSINKITVYINFATYT